MIKSKEELSKFLEKRLDFYAVNKKHVETMTKYLVEKYNFKPGDASDLATQRASTDTESNFICFCLTDALSKVDNRTKLEDWFTEKEINAFSKEQIHRDSLAFPVRIPAIQVSDDQWIGMCDCKFLMLLREAQMIYYNTNTQRTLQRVVRHGNESYRISINNVAVSDIKSAMQNGTYISDTISLNMPQDADFYYNADKRELVLNNIDHFDIIDGFHRYKAMCSAIDNNPDFNYPMELRIVQYDETKAKQFIWQQDQKTKMKKLDSDSMNVSAPENITVERLNQNPMFNFHGEVNRSGGLIAFQDLAMVVKAVYFNGVKKADERKVINSTVNELKEKINYISDADSELLSHRFTRLEIITLVIVLHELDDLTNANKIWKNVLEKVSEDKSFANKLSIGLSGPKINRVKNMMKGE